MFVRDRCVSHGTPVPSCTPHTELASVDSAGNEANGSSFSNDGAPGDSAISADGRFVMFVSFGTNLVPNDTNGQQDVFVHDRLTGETTRVSVDSAGSETTNTGYNTPTLSAAGRIASFTTGSANLAPGGSAARFDVFTHDGGTGLTETASVGTGGVQSDVDTCNGAVSGDGRFVMMDTGYFPAVIGPLGQGGALVRDRLTGVTERVDLDWAGTIIPNEIWPVVSRDGRAFAFSAGFPRKVYLRTIDPAHTTSDLSGDFDHDDAVLEAINTAGVPPGTATPTLLCPAGQVVVAGGRAAFPRPEASGATTPALPLCAAGTPITGGTILNADGNVDDEVVHYWPGSGSVQNLGLAASAVAMAVTPGDTIIAAIASDAGDVVETYKTSAASWTATTAKADTIAMCGSIVASRPKCCRGSTSTATATRAIASCGSTIRLTTS